MNIKKSLSSVCYGAALVLLSACEGLFEGIYDNDKVGDVVVAKEGQLYVDASDWTTWNYISLDKLAEGDESIEVMKIPTEEKTSSTSKTGIYTYWFDVFGEGLTKNEFEKVTLTDEQPEPDDWTFAIHREVVRTNGCGVIETNYTSFDELPSSSSWFAAVDFKNDEWSETNVWVNRERMLMGYVGSQGICINKVLSNWYQCILPPVPPSYIMNNHVFIMRTHEGKYAALQLANHMSANGTKCCFTINYKYPY